MGAKDRHFREHGEQLVPRTMGGGPPRAEKGVEGKVHGVVSQGQSKGSWERLAEIRCPVQTPWSGGYERHLGVRHACLHRKHASFWMCHLTQSLRAHESFFSF